MFTLSLNELMVGLAQMLWPFFRISAFMMTVPIIGTRLVPVRVRLLLAITFTAMLFPFLMDYAPALPFDDMTRLAWWQLMWVSVKEIFIGVALGFSVQILFHIAVVGGQMIAMQNGLGFATLIDPVNGINVAAVGQLYLMLTNLLFLTMNGHLAVLQVLTDSFTMLPISARGFEASGMMVLVGHASWLFGAALLVALPAVTALLLVNLAFGLMARLAPTLNIFAIGFPFNMVFGVLMIWFCVGGYLPQFEQFTAEHLDFMQLMISEF